MNSITKDKYIVEFAVDGKRWQTAKRGTIEKMWNDFVFNPEYRLHVAINPFGKVQLRNLTTNQIIGTLKGKQAL